MLTPIEDNYRQILTQRQIEFWDKFFTEGQWTKREIKTTLVYILAECKFLPSASDWVKLRPKKQEELPQFLREKPADSFDRLAKQATGWGRVVCEITAQGLKNKRDGFNRMPEAYTKLADKAREWKRPQSEIDGFIQARDRMFELRGKQHG